MVIIRENFRCLILNVGTHIVHIHTAFAYPCETAYADFVRVHGTAHFKVVSTGYSVSFESISANAR